MTLGLEPADDDLFQLLASSSSSEDRMTTSGMGPADDGDEEDRAAPDVSRGKVGAMAGDRKAEAEGQQDKLGRRMRSDGRDLAPNQHR